MVYTVQEVANLSGTTVKTLYHYQKVGLLFPNYIGGNGYRYYTEVELDLTLILGGSNKKGR